MPGFPDLFTILAILVIIFGATVLPQVGESIGRRIEARSRRGEPGDHEG